MIVISPVLANAYFIDILARFPTPGDISLGGGGGGDMVIEYMYGIVYIYVYPFPLLPTGVLLCALLEK